MIIPSFDNEIENGKVGFGVWATLFLSFILLGWYSAIGGFLQRKHIVNGVKLFTFNSIFSFLFMMLISIALLTKKELIQNNILIILGLSCYFLFSFFQILTYCAKLLAIDSKNSSHFTDYVGYVFLLWLFPIGIWFIQPRMNKLLSQTP
ncbi:hypothetical protein [Arcicella lustrica]|uniref:Uncharacterized protein n=1 Tax=Arcicella lustrica TaxID=2984196 RepID=A0ABU5SP78_9BACT|nr:hypothetical protein [Arcicella sp. DC25W]MEA5429123.1 hypothetical protein [Arcicella sp. DC25W]